MLRYLKINIICILFLALSFPASSELYQYKDENGIMRITDTIYSVPAGQRAQLEPFDEFEGLSNEIKILPVPDKSAPQTKNQTQVKKNTTPKTSKDISAEAGKNTIQLDAVKKEMAVKSKNEATDPFQPIFSEKPIEEPDTKVSPKQLHKSEKVTIRRIDKKTPSQTPARIKKPEKSIKKKTEPRKTPKADPESKIVRKDQSQTNIAIKPDTIKETPPKTTKKVVQVSEKPAAIKSAQKTGNPTVVKKETKTTDIIPDKKTTGSQQSNIEPIRNIKQSSTQPELKEKSTPEIKPEIKPEKRIISQKSEPIADANTEKTTLPKVGTADQKKDTVAKAAGPRTLKDVKKTYSSAVVKKEINVENIINDKKTAPHPKVQSKLPGKDIEKTAQPDIKATTVPQIKKTETDKPVPSQAEKDLDSLIAANKKDSKKLTDTKKVESDIRETTSKESELFINAAQTEHAVTTVTKSQKIETDNSQVTQKDESIVLAKLESTRKTLSNKKEALNKKFMALMKEKQEIEDSVDEDDEKSVLQYNKNVNKLNLKIKQYKTEKKFLQAEIEKYNHAIKQSALN